MKRKLRKKQYETNKKKISIIYFFKNKMRKKNVGS